MAVRTPPTTDLEELGAPERTLVVPATRRPRGPGPLRFVDVAFRPVRQRSLQPLLGLPQPLEGCLRLCLRLRITTGGGATHRIGGVLHLPRGIREIRSLLLAGQPLQPPRLFLDLVGQRALLRPAVATARLPFQGTATLPFGFLLLPTGEFLQLLEQLVHLPLTLFLRLLVRRLITARHLVEVLLEQIRKIALLLAAAAPTATALLLLDADLDLVLLLGLLENLQRLVLRRERTDVLSAGRINHR